MATVKQKFYNTLLSVIICLKYSSTSAIVACPNHPVVSSASISAQTGSDYNDTIRYTCNIGYYRTSGTLDWTCKENQLWEGIPLVCSKITCSNLPVVSSASISAQTGSHYDDTITYTCNIGYERTSGDLDWTCKENHLWDGIPLVCTKVTCPNLPVVIFVTVLSQTGSNYNDTIAYKCIDGYKRTGGNLVRTCKEDSHWDGTPPLCTKVTCQNTLPVTFSTISTTGNKYQDTLTYTCNTGYELTSGNLIRTCMENETWSGNPPVCTITCPDPGESDHVTRQLNGNNPTETVVYKCEFEYDYFSGDETRVCGNDGQWSGEKLVCKAYLAVPYEKRNLIVAGTLSGIFFILAITVIFLYCYCIVRKKKKRKMEKRIKNCEVNCMSMNHL